MTGKNNKKNKTTPSESTCEDVPAENVCSSSKGTDGLDDESMWIGAIPVPHGTVRVVCLKTLGT